MLSVLLNHFQMQIRILNVYMCNSFILELGFNDCIMHLSAAIPASDPKEPPWCAQHRERCTTQRDCCTTSLNDVYPLPRSNFFNQKTSPSLPHQNAHYFKRIIFDIIIVKDKISLVFYTWWGSAYLVSHGLGKVKTLFPGQRRTRMR